MAFQKGDIVMMDFNPQKGHEQMGRRPALVVSNTHYNRHCKLAIVCSITNTNKAHAFHVPLDDSTRTTGVVQCDQIKALDINARNAVFIETMPEHLLAEVTDILCAFIE